MLYSLRLNWWKVTRPAMASMLPVPQRYYVPGRVRESYRPRLEAAELWDIPGIEQEEEEDNRKLGNESQIPTIARLAKMRLNN